MRAEQACRILGSFRSVISDAVLQSSCYGGIRDGGQCTRGIGTIIKLSRAEQPEGKTAMRNSMESLSQQSHASLSPYKLLKTLPECKPFNKQELMLNLASSGNCKHPVYICFRTGVRKV
jgi:hypothetical protein